MAGKSRKPSRPKAPAESAPLDDFARRLSVYARSLSDKERAILHAMVEAALPPLERMAQREPSEVLNEEEQHILRDLLASRDSS